MAYVVAADFRAATLKWYTRGLALTDEEAPTADITSAIAAYSGQLDSWASDHYEPENALEVVVDQRHYSHMLHLPKRIRTVTTVKTVNYAGTETVETATDWRVHSSLNAAGTDFHESNEMDWLEVITGQYLTTGAAYWPYGIGTVKITGNWSWGAVPDRIKRAVAILVYDRFRAKGDSLMRAERWATDQASYDLSNSKPSGLPEVDEIIEAYSRKELILRP
jgi:hypothetical protein